MKIFVDDEELDLQSINENTEFKRCTDLVDTKGRQVNIGKAVVGSCTIYKSKLTGGIVMITIDSQHVVKIENNDKELVLDSKYFDYVQSIQALLGNKKTEIAFSDVYLLYLNMSPTRFKEVRYGSNSKTLKELVDSTEVYNENGIGVHELYIKNDIKLIASHVIFLYNNMKLEDLT